MCRGPNEPAGPRRCPAHTRGPALTALTAGKSTTVGIKAIIAYASTREGQTTLREHANGLPASSPKRVTIERALDRGGKELIAQKVRAEKNKAAREKIRADAAEAELEKNRAALMNLQELYNKQPTPTGTKTPIPVGGTGGDAGTVVSCASCGQFTAGEEGHVCPEKATEVVPSEDWDDFVENHTTPVTPPVNVGNPEEGSETNDTLRCVTCFQTVKENEPHICPGVCQLCGQFSKALNGDPHDCPADPADDGTPPYDTNDDDTTVFNVPNFTEPPPRKVTRPQHAKSTSPTPRGKWNYPSPGKLVRQYGPAAAVTGFAATLAGTTLMPIVAGLAFLMLIRAWKKGPPEKGLLPAPYTPNPDRVPRGTRLERKISKEERRLDKVERKHENEEYLRTLRASTQTRRSTLPHRLTETPTLRNEERDNTDV
jgi:hypothetical protein